MTEITTTDDGITAGDLAVMEAEYDQRPGLLLKSDDDPCGKTFPWRQMMAALRRIVPELALPTKGDRRDAVMKQFWRRHGKTVGAFELLATKVQASDYLMARNGHTGAHGRPYPWSWIFAKNAKGKLRADEILEGGYSTETMAFVLERAVRGKMTKVMLSSSHEPIEVNLSEIWDGEPRYKVCGTHPNGYPEVIDYRE